MTKPKPTDFQKRVLKLVPDFPSEISLTKLAIKVYGQCPGCYPGWKKSRGRKTAVSKALWRLEKLGLVRWPHHGQFNNYRNMYWQKPWTE